MANKKVDLFWKARHFSKNCFKKYVQWGGKVEYVCIDMTVWKKTTWVPSQTPVKSALSPVPSPSRRTRPSHTGPTKAEFSPPWPWELTWLAVLLHLCCPVPLASASVRVQTKFGAVTARNFPLFYFSTKDSELNLQFVPSFTFSPHFNYLCSS